MAHGWAAPPLVDSTPGTTSDALTRFVAGLAALPGAEYVLAVDAAGDRVRGEAGGPPRADLAVLDWARRVAAVSQERRHALEDLVLTTERAIHVVRLVPDDPDDPDAPDAGAAWVSVRIDRTRGNLASARRALAGLGAPGSSASPRPLPAGSPDSHRPSPPFAPFPPPGRPDPQPAALSAPRSPWGSPTPSPSPTSPGSRRPSAPWAPVPPARPTSSGPTTGSFPAAMPGPATPQGPAELPSPRSPRPDERPRPAWPSPEDRAAAKAQLMREWAAFAPGPPPASPVHGGDPQPLAMPEPPAPAAAAPASAPDEGEEAAEPPSARRLPATIRQAARWRDTHDADEPAAPDAWIPAARTSTESAPEPAVPAPRADDLFTPVTPVPRAWPMPEDDTGELSVPASVPAQSAIRPRPYVPDPGLSPRLVPQPWPAPDAGPDPDASPHVPDLPRRSPGAHLAPSLPAAHRSVPTVNPTAAVAGTAAFTTEHSVLRRLLDGLRRLT